MNKKKNWSGERLETSIYGDVAVEHLHRYAMASMLVKDKVVLDIASGEGYGSKILSRVAKSVTGVDIDQIAVDKASAKYKADNLKFLQGSADKMPLEDNSVDVLVSFETIEHHDRHEEMFMEIKRVLKPGGKLIMSSPDKKYYMNLQKNNPFHIKELFVEEFTDLAKKYFSNVDVYYQNCINGSSVIGLVKQFENLNIFSGNYDGIYKSELSPLYNLIIASESAVTPIDLFIFDGKTVSDLLREEQQNFIRNSTTFKLGHSILSPFLKFKKIFG